LFNDEVPPVKQQATDEPKIIKEEPKLIKPDSGFVCAFDKF
jgi:hypothetical protein